MSEDQVWKIILFFRTNRPKRIFSRLFQTGKWQKFFPCFFILSRVRSNLDIVFLRRNHGSHSQ